MECRKRGLKDTGKRELLIDRLETFDLGRRNEGGTTKKRERDDRTQEEKDKELLRVCGEGTLEEAIAALDADANPNTIDEKSVSALMKACARDDWKVAEAIVKELLRRGALSTLIDEDGYTALHWAASKSSCAIAELVANKAVVNQPDQEGYTPLLICCINRFDDEGVAVAMMLLDRGANIEHKNTHGSTPLTFACGDGSASMVESLLARKANVNAANADGTTPLMYACGNRMAGEAVIPMLIKAGANPTQKDNDGHTALNYAYTNCAVLMRAISSHIQTNDQLWNRIPGNACPDPIGCMHEAVRYGFTFNHPNRFRYRVNAGAPAEFCWSMLRVSPLCMDSSANDIFSVLAGSDDHRLWKYVIPEIGATRHPQTGETLFHVAARTNKVFAIDMLMRTNLNPLLRNKAMQRAVDLATYRDIIAKLSLHSEFQPTHRHADWYGPYFFSRAFTFLCMVARWKREGVFVMPKDVVMERF